jgi:hypothetical protein
VSRKLVLVAGGIIVVVVALLVGVWIFLTPADNAPAVPFSQLQSDVTAGEVDEIVIDGTTYRYRQRKTGSTTGTRLRAEGPKPTLAIVMGLHPASNDRMPPKIRFDDVRLSERPVAFSDFIMELDAKRVTAVHLDGRRWRYELGIAGQDAKPLSKETAGPPVTRDEAAAFVKAHAPAATFDVE